MPQLPSGRHIALDPSPIQEIITKAFDSGFGVHGLMAIETIEHLYSHIDILFFRPRADNNDASVSLANFSLVTPDELEPYRSGYNLISIQDEFNQWSYADQKAFLNFLNEKRTNHFLGEILETVRKYQEELLEEPTSLQGLLATWWKMGCHPLQDELNDI